MSEPIRIKAKSRGDVTEVTLLMPHPMETGLRKNEVGEFIAAHYITDVQVTVEGRVVLESKMSLAMARDPLLGFRITGAKAGERIKVTWIDNRRHTRTDEALIG